MSRECRVISVVVIAMLLVHFGSAIVNGELLVHWKLDETGGSRVSDSSGNGYDATLLGGMSFDKDSTEGVLGSSIHLDGDNGRIVIDSLSLPAGAFTISFWLSFDSDLDRDNGRKYLMFWMGPTRPAGDKPIIVVNKGGNGLVRYYYSVGDSQYYINSKIKAWKGLTWHHFAVIYDNYSAKFYLDGVLEGSGEHSGKHFASSGVSFGARPEGGNGLKGRIDDIRIYSHVLTAGEIGDLAGLDPVPEGLRTAVSQAEALTAQKAGTAIEFIEDKIVELEQWGDEIPERYMSHFKELSFDLYFALAKAKLAADQGKVDIAVTFDQAYSHRTPSLSNCGSVLAWLLENGRTREYEKLVELLNEHGKDYLKDVASQAGKMSLGGRAQAAIKFIAANLASYSDWRKKHPDSKAAAGNGLPLMYFELANAKVAVGAVKQEVGQAYSKTFVSSRDGYVKERSEALVWLLENDFKVQYGAVIKSFASIGVSERPYGKMVGSVCRDLESKGQWEAFEAFLHSLLGEGENSFAWAVFVESCLGDTRNAWARQYYKYLKKNSRELFGWDWRAEQLSVSEKYRQASALYSDIVKNSGPKDAKSALEYQLCRNLFYGGEYAKGAARLKSLIGGGNASDSTRIRKAMMMQGHCHLQLGESDAAIEAFSAVSSKYPDSSEAVAARFLVGYCYMVAKKFDQAKEAFDRVVKNHSGSSHASKAALCLLRMDGMAN